jgi:hypothetical protein
MKPKLLIVFLIVISGTNLFSQNNTTLKFIFIPHPRSEEMIKQSVNPGIAKIDFTKFAIKMLGGDITYSTSKNRAALSYCDSLFDLKNPNTLWSFGNHDVESGNRALIKEFTGRDSYYSYCRDGITFIILDTELNANGFSRTFIKDDQLQLVKNVCDTISDSRFLILLHSRYMWMINNDYFKSRLTDSIAASSRSMDTTNFYADIYPLLKKVKSRGIQVMVFGGDKSKINITYTPEDSITFYAARMANDFSDSANNVIVLDYDGQDKTINCNYVSLAKIEQNIQDTLTSNSVLNNEEVLRVWQISGSREINVQFHSSCHENIFIEIYSINGGLCQSFNCKANEIRTLEINKTGIYFVKASAGISYQVKKFVIQ